MPITKDNWNQFKKSTPLKALDGIEEVAKGPILTQMKVDCPVAEGTMRGSLTTERDDKNLKVYVGGGGPAKDYIYRQEMDRSLSHTSGKAGFIRDSVEMHAPKLKQYVEKHIK